MMLEEHDDEYFFNLRKEGKTYISKAFTFPYKNEEMRNVFIVFEHSDLVVAGEIDGCLSLRQTPNGKQQIVALITQDDKKIKRLTLQKFHQKKMGDFSSSKTDAFTFRADEFVKLKSFLESVEFIDFSNKANHQIEDLSSNTGNKALIDHPESAFLNILKNCDGDQRKVFLNKIRENLSKEDIEILLGRKEALEIFEAQLICDGWKESNWQDFFEIQNWIFGYGIDYRIMRQFDRELNVSGVGTDNKEKVIVDFLMTFNDFTVTVEIKRPTTPIFEKKKNRSGSWSFSQDFIDAFSQVLEQKTEWHILAQNNNLYNKEGNEKLLKRTRDAKTILVIGNKAEFLSIGNLREKEIKQDTFELFRQGSKNVDIITFDELLERAEFIVKNK